MVAAHPEYVKRVDGCDVVVRAGGSQGKVALVSGGGSGHGGGGDAELLLQSVDELAELQNGQTLDLFDHGGNFLRHCMEPPDSKFL